VSESGKSIKNGRAPEPSQTTPRQHRGSNKTKKEGTMKKFKVEQKKEEKVHKQAVRYSLPELTNSTVTSGTLSTPLNNIRARSVCNSVNCVRYHKQTSPTANSHSTATYSSALSTHVRVPTKSQQSVPSSKSSKWIHCSPAAERFSYLRIELS
jgi:hypothetical protein